MNSPRFRGSSIDRALEARRMRAYESLRPSALEFQTQTPALGVKKSESMVQILRTKVSDLESHNRSLENKLSIAYRTISDLRDELESMRDHNRKLLGDRLETSTGDSHYLVQQLLITEANTKISDAKSEVDKFRIEAKRQQKKVGLIRDNTKKLEGVVKQYRRMLAEALVSNRKKAASSMDYSSDALPSIKSRLKNSKVSQRSNVNVFLGYFQSLIMETDLRAVFTSAMNTCRSVIGCSHCTMYIISQRLQSEYTSLFTDKNPPNRIIIGTSWIFLHTDQEADYNNPLFNKIEEVNRGIIGTDYMIYPLTHKKDLQFILQCEGIPQKIEKKEEVLLKLVLSGLRHSLAYYYSLKMQKQLKGFIDQTASCMASISLCRTHQALSNTIYSEFPKLLNYEGASIVYVSDKEFYTNVYSSADDERFGYDLVKYPCTLGLSAVTLESRSIKVFNDLKKSPLYSPDVDNLAGLKEVKNCLMVCLPGTRNNSIVGILILSNKKFGNLVNDDFSLIERIAKNLGSFVTGINDSVEALEVTVRMRATVSDMVQNIHQNLGVPAEEINKLSDLMHIMNTRIHGLNSKNEKEVKLLSSK